MITFDRFIAESGTPIYLQIVRHIKQGIVAKEVKDGDEMPSRRVLSALLGINPNTVQKAYRMLEDDSIIESRSGAKSLVTLDDKKIARIREELLEDELRSVVHDMKKMGVSKEEAASLIDRLWGRGWEQ